MKKHKTIKKLLNLSPKYSYRMCYNSTGEVFNPDGSTYDIFNNRKELIKILSQISNL
jgi:hypothetical protein